MNRDYDPIDEAYSIFARTGPEFGGGLSNHGPMAAEALAAMHRPDAIARWAHRYAKRLGGASVGIVADFRARFWNDWREALGKEKRVGDWIAFFDESLKADAVARRPRSVGGAARAWNRRGGFSRRASHRACGAIARRSRKCNASSRTRGGSRLLGGDLSTLARFARRTA